MVLELTEEFPAQSQTQKHTQSLKRLIIVLRLPELKISYPSSP